MRVALVTGASRGIGREAARQLAEAGLAVVVAARDLGRSREVVGELPAALDGRGVAVNSV